MRFVPLSERRIGGEHACVDKVLNKASSAGPAFFSMAERMPLLME